MLLDVGSYSSVAFYYFRITFQYFSCIVFYGICSQHLLDLLIESGAEVGHETAHKYLKIVALPPRLHIVTHCVVLL